MGEAGHLGRRREAEGGGRHEGNLTACSAWHACSSLPTPAHRLTAGRMPSSARSTMEARFMSKVVRAARRNPTEAARAAAAPPPAGRPMPSIAA